MAKKNAPLMKGFKLKYWQVSLFKLSCISFGLLLAIYFGDFFAQLTTLLWVTTVVPGVYLAYVWFNQK